jgi:hypothetical protein
MLLLFFCSKKVSKKGALQLEEILHPSSLKAKNSKLGANEFAPQTVEIFFAFSQCGSRSISSRP